MALQRLALALVVTGLLVWDPMPVLGAWRTLSGKAPVIIADGGTSGLYPDQILPAYLDALNYSLPGVVLTCDLQISKSANPALNATGTGICRKNLNLKNSTVIWLNNPELMNTYIVDGVNTTGWFAIDITYETLQANGSATQSVLARTPAFDGRYQIFKPEFLPSGTTGGILDGFPASTWWLNAEYTRFIEANSIFNATQTTIEIVQQFVPGYMSAPDINLLREIRDSPNTNGTKFIYKFLDTAEVDASTNQSYTTLLQNMSFIKTFASGILVPKSYILPIDSNNYLETPTSLVDDAHKANLEVYAYTFSNDQHPNSYNYSSDPIIELLSFMEKYNFSVDGVFTGFPTTSSEAISCYSANSRNGSVIKESTKKQVVISHNGDSGRFPGATNAAYASAIAAGVDYIDCIVQITKDSVPICLPTPNLIDTTNIVNFTNFYPVLQKSYEGFNDDIPGIYTFDLYLSEIQTLKCIAYNGIVDFPSRDPGYNGQFGILTLAQFLAIAKESKVGALIDMQNAVYLRNVQNLAVVDAVVAALSAEQYNSSDKVIMQSEDSSALKRLRILGVTYPLMYEVIWDQNNPISLDASDFAQIKEFASNVNLDKRLLEPLSTDLIFGGFTQGPPTDLVTLAHDQNLTVYFQVQKNEPITFAFDLKLDPTLQLFSMEYYGVDGVITDFPSTVMSYEENQCGGTTLKSSVTDFSIPLVVPGFIIEQYINDSSGAPAPNLMIPEAPLSGITVPAPTPGPGASAAAHLSMCFVVPALIVAIQLLVFL